MPPKSKQKSPPFKPKSRPNIIIRGARVHNLKNISLELPRNKLIVVTGVSGSGKSSLAFDTIYAEGQRRFVESLSAYARQFLERMDKPDVDLIQGISPAIAIEQRTAARNPRSTVGTSTEIYDYLRLLYARIGKTICYNCGSLVQKDTVQTVLDRLNEESKTSGDLKLYVMFPMAEHADATLDRELESLKKRGFFRILYKNELIDLSTEKFTKKAAKKDIAIVVDRLIYRSGQVDTRFTDSIETAFVSGDGHAVIKILADGAAGKEFRFNQQFACANCGIKYEEPDPRMFSFNNPYGACPKCEGFGKSLSIDLDLVVPNRDRSIQEGAIHPWTFPKWNSYLHDMIVNGSRAGIRTDVPFRDLTKKEIELVLDGGKGFKGVNAFFEMIEKKGYKIYYRVFLSRYRQYTRCDSCGGSRLRRDALYVKIADKTIADIVSMTLDDAKKFFATLELTKFEIEIARRILGELNRRIEYLVQVGIGYLTLDRLSSTLSGGETQRINLATALGSSLVGSLYVLDEPSIGLHPRDTQRLIAIMKSLRDVGNTVMTVEHDAAIMADADVIVDMGPLAGEGGGEIVFLGTMEELKKSGKSLTAQYLTGKKSIEVPAKRRTEDKGAIRVLGAAEHNLKTIDVSVPLGKFVCITGVSGSGKSTFVHDILYPGIKRQKGQYLANLGKHNDIEGTDGIDDVEMVDQTPIGKTPRSNPATYVKAFDFIRDVFSKTQAAKIRDFGPGAFSFNVPGGRCEACEGSGIQTVEMQFLADLELTCEVCRGKRFKKEILDVRYRDKNIDDVLGMTVTEAVKFFNGHASGRNVAKRLRYLEEVGMGYIRLGQSGTTLSGGESQRVKLAAHLSTQIDGIKSLFIFDEPTTGLHFDDIAKLLASFNALLERGNSLVVIEHNMDVVKCADWVIDLGPEAGDKGGYVVAAGTPEQVAEVKESYTGQFLKRYLKA
ncbi:MAG TPA: excinuclease ABC subunit UvrA [Bacteroidota bacterium]|nr:excinuclease ABC subunit UvrA [Bacteroidota bacterium]